MPYSAHGPGYKKMDTAYDAAEKIEPRVKPLHSKILACLDWNGPMTSDETARRLSESVLAIRPRFTELLVAGMIVDTGIRRKNASGRSAAVWQVKVVQA